MQISDDSAVSSHMASATVYCKNAQEATLKSTLTVLRKYCIVATLRKILLNKIKLLMKNLNKFNKL